MDMDAQKTDHILLLDLGISTFWGPNSPCKPPKCPGDPCHLWQCLSLHHGLRMYLLDTLSSLAPLQQPNKYSILSQQPNIPNNTFHSIPTNILFYSTLYTNHDHFSHDYQ